MKGLLNALRRARKNTGKMLRMDHVFEEQLSAKPLITFDSPEAVGLFRLMTDADMGGKSTASWRFDPDLRCGVFEGTLDLTPAANVSNSGFAAVVLREGSLGPWDLEDYDALAVRARSDGRIYVTNLRAPSVIEDDLWQAYTVGARGEAADIVLPFSRFIATHRGFVEGQIALDTRTVESLGVLMAERRDGPFRLELHSISAINTELYGAGRRWTGVSDDSRQLD